MKKVSDKEKIEHPYRAKKNSGPSISTNLRKLMTLSNINETELSRRTNIKQPIIHRLLSGQNKNPKLMTIKPLADYFMLSISQLIGQREITSTWEGFTSKNHQGWIEVPLINWTHACEISKKNTSKFVLTESHVSDHAFAVYIIDQSMEPLFPEKSIAIIEPELVPVNGNYIVIKNTKNEFMVRNFIVSSGNKFISPLSHKFGTITKISDDDKILGVAVRTIYDHL